MKQTLRAIWGATRPVAFIFNLLFSGIDRLIGSISSTNANKRYRQDHAEELAQKELERAALKLEQENNLKEISLAQKNSEQKGKASSVREYFESKKLKKIEKQYEGDMPEEENLDIKAAREEFERLITGVVKEEPDDAGEDVTEEDTEVVESEKLSAEEPDEIDEPVAEAETEQPDEPVAEAEIEEPEEIAEPIVESAEAVTAVKAEAQSTKEIAANESVEFTVTPIESQDEDITQCAETESSENKMQLSEKTGEMFERAKAAADEKYNLIKQKAIQTIGTAKIKFAENLAATKEKLDKSVEQTKEKISDSVDETKQQLGKTASDAKQQFSKTAESTKEQLEKAAVDAKEQLTKAASTAKEKSGELINSIGEKVNPDEILNTLENKAKTIERKIEERKEEKQRKEEELLEAQRLEEEQIAKERAAAIRREVEEKKKLLEEMHEKQEKRNAYHSAVAERELIEARKEGIEETLESIERLEKATQGLEDAAKLEEEKLKAEIKSKQDDTK